jgi:hypothetical protein
VPEFYVIRYTERYPAPPDDADDADDGCPDPEVDGPEEIPIDLDELDLDDADGFRDAVREVGRAVDVCGEPSCLPLPAGDLDHVWVTGEGSMDPRTGETERPSFHRGTVPGPLWAAFLRHRFVK